MAAVAIPMVVGAAVGAASAAIQRKNIAQGALMGGTIGAATGGMGGGEAIAGMIGSSGAVGGAVAGSLSGAVGGLMAPAPLPEFPSLPELKLPDTTAKDNMPEIAAIQKQMRRRASTLLTSSLAPLGTATTFSPSLLGGGLGVTRLGA